jgi:hypothetical protein
MGFSLLAVLRAKLLTSFPNCQYASQNYANTPIKSMSIRYANTIT